MTTPTAEPPRSAWLVWVRGLSGKVFPQLWYEPFVGTSNSDVVTKHKLPIGAERVFTLDQLAGLPALMDRAS